MHYDPMIAKLIVWDHDRSRAVRRLQQTLAEAQVVGVTANLGFLAAVAAHPAFAAGQLDTAFIGRHHAELFPEANPASDSILALACLDLLLRRTAEAITSAGASGDPYSPWHSTGGWQLNSDNFHRLDFIDGGQAVQVTAHFRAGGYQLDLPGGSLLASGSIDEDGDLCADLGGRRCRATVVRNGNELAILCAGHRHLLIVQDPAQQATEREDPIGRLTAPMPGKIVAVMVAAGDQVERGRPLVVLEAMKMEHTITAPAAGVVASLPFAVGDVVSEGEELLVFEAEGGTE
jgi:3-methylcrotonyl-CoA carboxylase alpha subunit